MKTAAVLVLVWIASVSAQLQQSGPCPQVPFVRKFDLNKMMGQWYEQIHTQRWSDLELDCNSHLFTFISNTSFTYDTFARNPTRANQYHKRGNVQLKKKEKGLALDVSEGGDSYDVIVVDTDYTTFATLWTCMPGESSHFENVVVLTRQKFPGLSALLSALDALDAKNITRMYLVYTEQRNCPKFTASPPDTPTLTSPIPPAIIVTTASPSTSLSDSTSKDSNTEAPGLPSTTTLSVNITVIPPIDLNMTTPIILAPINPNFSTTPSYQEQHTNGPYTKPGVSTEGYITGSTANTKSGSSVPTKVSNVTPSSGGTTIRTGVTYYTTPSAPDILFPYATTLPPIPGVSSVAPEYRVSDPESGITSGQVTTKTYDGLSGTTSPSHGGGSTTLPPAVKASATKNSFMMNTFVFIFTTIFISQSLLFII